MTKSPRNAGRWMGLALVVFLIAIVFIIVFVRGLFVSITSTFSELDAQVDTSAVPGDPTHFDPIASYDTVHQYAGADLELASIDIEYVRPDGTLDLTASYDPHVDYEFFRELETPPPNMPPVGSKGVTDQKWDDMREVLIQPSRMLRTGGYVQGRQAIPAPKCSLSKMWSDAIEQDASRNAVATVYVNFRGYNFRIQNTHIDLDYDLDCHPTNGSYEVPTLSPPLNVTPN